MQGMWNVIYPRAITLLIKPDSSDILSAPVDFEFTAKVVKKI